MNLGFRSPEREKPAACLCACLCVTAVLDRQQSEVKESCPVWPLGGFLSDTCHFLLALHHLWFTTEREMTIQTRSGGKSEKRKEKGDEIGRLQEGRGETSWVDWHDRRYNKLTTRGSIGNKHWLQVWMIDRVSAVYKHLRQAWAR